MLDIFHLPIGHEGAVTKVSGLNQTPGWGTESGEPGPTSHPRVIGPPAPCSARQSPHPGPSVVKRRERVEREREERDRAENERARFPPDDDSTRRRSIWQRHRLRLRRGNQPGSSLEILDSTTAVALGLQPIWM